MGSVGKASGGGGGTEIPGTDERRRRRNEEPQSLQEFQQMSLRDAADFIDRSFDAIPPWSEYSLKMNSQGMNPYPDLQYLIEILDAHGTPTVLSDKDYDAISLKEDALGGVEVYRGLGWSKDGDSKFQDQFLFGDKTFIGDGVHGQGIYMTTSKSYANAYSGHGMQETTSVTGFIDKSRAKIISEDALSTMFWSEPSEIRNLFRNDRLYALYKGYNVIVCPGGNMSDDYAYDKGYDDDVYMDFYLPLTRDVLVMREHTKLRNR